jgi:hypothetical protein
VVGAVALGAAWAQPAGTVEVAPAAVDFGAVEVGDAATATVTVRAVGGPVEYNHAEVTAPAFTVDESACAGLVLADGESCPLVVTFRPAEVGDAAAGLSVAVVGDARTVALTATAFDVAGPSSTDTSALPTTETTGTPPPPTSEPETLDECDARALDARVTYQPAREMRVGDQEEVVVVATIGDQGTTSLPGGGSSTVVPSPLTCQVRARLVGTDFTIAPDDWTTKSFQGSDSVRWLWTVTPERAGDTLALILEVQGLRFDDRAGTFVEAGGAFETTAEIRVRSTPASLASRVNGLLTHPVGATVAGAAVLGAAGWGAKRVQRARAASSARPRPGGAGSRT